MEENYRKDTNNNMKTILDFNDYIMVKYLYNLDIGDLIEIASDELDTTIIYNEPSEIDEYFDSASDLLKCLDKHYNINDEFAYFDDYGYLCSANYIYDIIDKSEFAEVLEDDDVAQNEYEEYIKDILNEYTPQELLEELENSTNETVEDIILNEYEDTIRDGLTEEIVESYKDTENKNIQEFIEEFIENNEIGDR